MWQYQNTDELYHNNYYKNLAKQSKTELYHSDVYLGKDYSDGIKHYKYIRKYQKNGKTYYVYDNSEEKRNDEKAKNAIKMINNIGKNGYYDDKGYKHFISTENGISSRHATMGPFTINGVTSKHKRTAKDIISKKAIDAAFKFIAGHKIQKIIDIPKKIHAKGLAAVSKAMMYIDDKKAKRKSKK